MAKRTKQQSEEQVVVEQTQAGAEQPQAPEATGTTGTTESGHEANGHGPRPAPGRRTDERLFSSEAEARTAGPLPGLDGGKWRLWTVSGPVSGPGGSTVYLWASGHGMAVVRGAAHLGVTATCLDRPVNREALAAGLAAMTEEERRALLEQYLNK
jgi:hypothetical protein